MNTEQQIQAYLATLPAPKQADLRQLQQRILALAPGTRRWFLDGRNESGKVVSNPSIGYGELSKNYADGSSKAFYQVGLSANTGGLSLYVMGITDKTFLSRTFGATLGKAAITGYCIKFKKLDDLDPDVLDEVLRTGLAAG